MVLHTMLGTLLLLTALLGLSSACPLILDPPELVGEFGKAAVVNCTTEVEDSVGLFWTLDGKKKDSDVGPLFNELLIQPIDWKTQAKCTLKLNETYECSKDLGIKVYKRPSSITVLSNGAPVAGKQLEIDCMIRDVATIQNLTITWYRDNTVEKKEGYYYPANTTRNEISSLTWNVSREQDGATFMCEAAEFGPHGPLFVSNNTWKVYVQYAPEFEEKKQDIVVNNSESISLRCEAAGNPPPHYKWIKDGATVTVNTNLLNISQVNETMTYECVALNYLGSVTKVFNITVIETKMTPTPAPKSSGCPVTLTPDHIVVAFGEPVSVNCSTTETDIEGMGWESIVGSTGLELKNHTTWSITAAHWTTEAQCFLNLNNGDQCKKNLNITVWKSPNEVKVSANSTSSMEEGKPFLLKCHVSKVAPVGKLHVNWYRDQELLKTDKFNDSNSTPKNATSILELIPEKEHNGANFTCEAELLLGQEQNPKVTSTPHTANVQYKPRIISCPTHFEGKEGVFQLDAVPCKAQGNPEPAFEWYLNGKWVNSTERLTRGNSGTYTAKFTNLLGETSATVDITVQYGPSFSCDDNYKVRENHNFINLCEPEGIPKPESVWWKDGMKFAFPKKWRRQDSGLYRIEATNQHGQVNRTMSINVLYIPQFSDEAIKIEFSLGDNVTLCSADGNPPPALRLALHPTAANVLVPSRGRHRYVLVTAATSSNEGLYSCTATNEVGSVSKTVTLMLIAEKARGISNINLIFLVLLLLLLFIVIIFVICRYYKKKSGRYNVISDGVPLTTRSKVV